MSHRSTFLSGLPLAVLIGTTVLGQYATAAEPSSAVVAKLDKDKDNDQTLDWTEVQAGASARFDKLNKDSDGTLDDREVQGVIDKAMFKAADPDNYGTLSKTEYLELVKKLFKKADADNDGTLDAKELSSKAGHGLKPLID
jgi:Ca2+-binding EF-hand superfamily protein